MIRYYEKNLKPSKGTEERHVPANLFFKKKGKKKRRIIN